MENRIAVGLVMTREHKGTTLYRGRGEVVDKIALCSETHTSFKSKLVRERPDLVPGCGYDMCWARQPSRAGIFISIIFH